MKKKETYMNKKSNRNLTTIAQEIKPEEDGILIVWNRQTGHYCVSYQGAPIHISSFTGLLATISQMSMEQIDENDYWKPSLPNFNKEEKNLDLPLILN